MTDIESRDQIFKKKTTVKKDTLVLCATCSDRLIFPYEVSQKFQGSYHMMDNSINLNRHLIIDDLPLFFCGRCWMRLLLPSFAEVVITVKKRFMENNKTTQEAPEEFKNNLTSKVSVKKDENENENEK